MILDKKPSDDSSEGIIEEKTLLLYQAIVKNLNRTNEIIGGIVGLLNQLASAIEDTDTSYEVKQMANNLDEMRKQRKLEIDMEMEQFRDLDKMISSLSVEMNVRVREKIEVLERTIADSNIANLRLVESVNYLANAINTFLTDEVSRMSARVNSIDKNMITMVSSQTTTDRVIINVENILKKLPVYSFVISIGLTIAALFGFTEIVLSRLTNKIIDRTEMHTKIERVVTENVAELTKRYFEAMERKLQLDQTTEQRR